MDIPNVSFKAKVQYVYFYRDTIEHTQTLIFVFYHRFGNPIGNYETINLN